MGYKLAGFNVIGGNDIDEKMAKVYQQNHRPRHFFHQDIRTLMNSNLPEELYQLDILDGSPPCSNFSMAGSREKDWGKKKKFREGQAEQVLDDLVYEQLRLAQKLRPKAIVIENVKGLTMGNAKAYVVEIYQRALHAGYYLSHYILNSSDFGVPQSRERIFFVGIRKDLAIGLTAPLRSRPEFRSLHQESSKKIDLQNINQVLTPLRFSATEPKVTFAQIAEAANLPEKKITNAKLLSLWHPCPAGKSLSTVHPNGSYFSYRKVDFNRPLPTVTATGNNLFHPTYPRTLTDTELLRASSWPTNYNFCGQNVNYVVGMSVPPVMMAHLASAIREQYLPKVNLNQLFN